MSTLASRNSLQGSISLLIIISGAFLWSWMDQCIFGPTLFSLVDLQGAGYLVLVLMLFSILGLFAARVLSKQQIAAFEAQAEASSAKAVTSVIPVPFIGAFVLVGAAGAVLCFLAYGAQQAYTGLSLAGVSLMGFSMGALILVWGTPVVSRGVEFNTH